MRGAVVIEATTELILSTEERMRLALDVEEAMTKVRSKLVYDFLSDLKRYIESEFKALRSDGWKIYCNWPGGNFMAARSRMTLQRDSWTDGNGVSIETGRANWAWVYLGISLNGVSDEEHAYLKSKAESVIAGWGVDKGWPAVRVLEQRLSDWSARDFLIRAGFPTLKGEQATDVQELGERMLALARVVAPVVDELYGASGKRGASL